MKEKNKEECIERCENDGEYAIEPNVTITKN